MPIGILMLLTMRSIYRNARRALVFALAFHAMRDQSLIEIDR